MKTVLITGFEPFEKDAINASWEAVRRLRGTRVRSARLLVRRLPVQFAVAGNDLIELVAGLQPDVVIAVGQAGGRVDIGIERIAINIDDARIADNAGRTPVDQTIARLGNSGYWSTLPVKAALQNLHKAGIPASVSNTAGTFVCNHVFYRLMHYLSETRPHVRAGFVHVPYLPEQAAKLPGQPSLSWGFAARALRIIAATALAEATPAARSA